MILFLRSLEEMELHKAGDFFEMAVPAGPELFKRGLRSGGYLKAVHCDVHVDRSLGMASSRA